MSLQVGKKKLLTTLLTTLFLQFIFWGNIFELLLPLNLFICLQPNKSARFLFTHTPNTYSEWTNKTDLNILSLKDIITDNNKKMLHCRRLGKNICMSYRDKMFYSSLQFVPL